MNISGDFQSPTGFGKLTWNVQGPNSLPPDERAGLQSQEGPGLAAMHQGPNSLPPDERGGLQSQEGPGLTAMHQGPNSLPPDERKDVLLPPTSLETSSQPPELEKHIQGPSLPPEKQDQSTPSIKLPEIVAHYRIPSHETAQIENESLVSDDNPEIMEAVKVQDKSLLQKEAALTITNQDQATDRVQNDAVQKNITFSFNPENKPKLFSNNMIRYRYQQQISNIADLLFDS